MAGCDGWITIKIFELIFATFCMIYKRVTDDEANKLFYFLQKYSREWPLLNNITWEENGAIFTNITYGGFIIIIIGLIIAQCSGELQKCRKLENFFLIMGALLFIAAGSLELAALESVEERLVDNAAILGVFSLVTGFLFIIDLLSASKRRKKEHVKLIQKYTQSKLTQTEEKKPAEIHRSGDMNGNVQNSGYHYQTGHFQNGNMQNGHKIPRNGVKILPSSPVITEGGLVPVVAPNEYMAYQNEPIIIDPSELKTHEGRLKSTESFLRSEKGLYPRVRKPTELDKVNNHFYIPAGYVLVPSDQIQGKSKSKSDSGIGDSPTPPGYAKIIPDTKTKYIKTPPGYVMIPVDQADRKDGSRKLQSPSITTTTNGPQEFYYVEGPGTRSQSPAPNRSVSNRNSSDASDIEEARRDNQYRRSRKYHKYAPEYLEMDSKNQKYFQPSEDSSDEQKFSYDSRFRPESRHSMRSVHGSKEWRYYSKGKVNDGFADEKEPDVRVSSRRHSPYRSSRASSPEKPKSILRFDYGRSSKKEDDLYFPKDVRYDSLDSQKIAEDLRNIKKITKSDIDLTRNLEKENKVLKERLRLEKEEKEKLKYDLEDKRKMEQQMKEAEEEKNRRISEREEQYFGIKDLKQSHKENIFEGSSKLKHLEDYLRKDVEKAGKGAKEINERLKEKYLEHENKAAREIQEYRDLIDEKFYFLDEEEKKKTKKSNPKVDESVEGHSKPTPIKKSESDETAYTHSTDEEIRLRVETPGSASYKSEALFWLGNDGEEQNKSPTPTSPGYVLYTAQNWPESPSPQDRFQFSAKEAQQLTIGTPPKTPIPEPKSQKPHFMEFQESQNGLDRDRRKGLLLRKVDFPNQPLIEIKKPTTVAGSTSTWKKWLQPKTKLQQTRSVPN